MLPTVSAPRPDLSSSLEPTLARGREATGALAVFALALGTAGTLLGVTVVWFFAAIPLGIAAIVIGGIAMAHAPLAHQRARPVIAIALGLVAVLLGVLSAILLPMALDRADRALNDAAGEVTDQIDKVDRSLAENVDQLDVAMTRELRNFERQNHREVNRFVNASTAELRRLERRMARAEKNLPRQQVDLARMSNQLRTELAALETSLLEGSSTTQADADAMAARVVALESALGAPPAVPVGPARAPANG